MYVCVCVYIYPTTANFACGQLTYHVACQTYIGIVVVCLHSAYL